jgi:hypothetical protein
MSASRIRKPSNTDNAKLRFAGGNIMATIKIKNLAANLKIDKDQLRHVFGGVTVAANNQTGQGGTENIMLPSPTPGPVPTPYPSLDRESESDDINKVKMGGATTGGDTSE